MVLNLFRENGVQVAGILDSDEKKWGCEIEGVKISEPINLDRDAGYVITCVNPQTAEMIENSLVSLGVPQENVRKKCDYLGHELDEKQYFDEDIIKLGKEEVFVDAGAYHLETSVRFANRCLKAGFKDYKIYAFEPDEISHETCQEIVADKRELENVQLFNYGLWNKKDMLCFDGVGGSASKVVEMSSQKIEVVDLDSVVNERVSFVKMDLEGAEMEALRGAQETIKKYRPRLAISIYHKEDDMYEIPMYIKELVPEYRLFIRHYSDALHETVLYAVI